MASPLVPAIVMLLGLGLYAVPHGKVSEVGRLLFFVGAFWLVDLFARARLHVG